MQEKKSKTDAPESGDTLALDVLIELYNRGWADGRGGGGTQPSRGGEKWKNSCLCSKAADSPLFFQLRTAATNSVYSMLAYGNKAVCEITTGIFTPSPPLSLPLTKSSAWCIYSDSDRAGAFSWPRWSPFFSLTFINCLVVKTESKSLQCTLSEEHCMYPLHFMPCWVQPAPQLSGCYYGDASRAKTKAEQKRSSLRLLAELWRTNLACQQRLLPSLSLSLIYTPKVFITKQILT